MLREQLSCCVTSRKLILHVFWILDQDFTGAKQAFYSWATPSALLPELSSFPKRLFCVFSIDDCLTCGRFQIFLSCKPTRLFLCFCSFPTMAFTATLKDSGDHPMLVHHPDGLANRYLDGIHNPRGSVIFALSFEFLLVFMTATYYSWFMPLFDRHLAWLQMLACGNSIGINSYLTGIFLPTSNDI